MAALATSCLRSQATSLRCPSAVFGNVCRSANLRMQASTLSLATSMPTTTRSFCAIIHSLPCSVRAQRPLQLFGKTPELSLALEQALPLRGATGSVPATGGWAATARSHILPDFLDTRGASRSSRVLGAGCDGRKSACDERGLSGRRNRVVLAPLGS